MKKRKWMLSFLFLGLMASQSAFAFFGGKGGPMEVIEIGPNVKMNTLTKIDQAKNTLEAIQQTKNQFVSLANEAKHLEVWSSKILSETVGLTQQDIDNVLAIKKMSGELYQDSRDFQKNWKSTFDLDYSRMSPEDLARNYEKNSKRYDDLLKRSIEEKGRAKETLDGISKKMKDFNRRNAAVVGTNQALQLGNEITNSMNANIQKLTYVLQQQEAGRMEKEKLLQERRNLELKAIKEDLDRKWTLPPIPTTGYVEI